MLTRKHYSVFVHRTLTWIVGTFPLYFPARPHPEPALSSPSPAPVTPDLVCLRASARDKDDAIAQAA
ncbi:hypothetical protein, partial [Xanthomonas perforans]